MNTEVVVAVVQFSRMLHSGWSPPYTREVPMLQKGVDKVEGYGYSGVSLYCVWMHEKFTFIFLDAAWDDIDFRAMRRKKGRLGSAAGHALGK